MSVERAFRKPIQHSKSKKYGLKNQNPKDKVEELSIIEILTEISVNEPTFNICLKSASINQIQKALEIMAGRNEHDKSRINYCNRELKRRSKALQKMNEMEGK